MPLAAYRQLAVVLYSSGSNSPTYLTYLLPLNAVSCCRWRIVMYLIYLSVYFTCRVLIHLYSVHIGRSSTRGRCSRRCHTCWALVMAGTLHRVCRTSGWRWSACCPVPSAMHSSSATQRHLSSLLTRPNDSTARRFETHNNNIIGYFGDDADTCGVLLVSQLPPAAETLMTTNETFASLAPSYAWHWTHRLGIQVQFTWITRNYVDLYFTINMVITIIKQQP